MSPEEKAAHAYEKGALVDLLMGKWPYYEPEAYMAPSNVPTNWRKLLKGLAAIEERHPDLAEKLEEALNAAMVSPEGMYCALATVLAYFDMRPHLFPHLNIDYVGILDKARQKLPALVAEAIALHPDWLGPTTESLWDRIEGTARRLADEYGVAIL